MSFVDQTLAKVHCEVTVVATRHVQIADMRIVVSRL